MIHLFKTFLPLAEKIYDRKTSIDILHHICMHDGYLHMTDLNIFVRLPVESKDSYTIPIKLLKKVLNAKPATLSVETLNSGKARINFDNKHLTFPFMNAQEYPSWPQERFSKIARWDKKVFLQLVQQVSFASADVLRPALTGVCVKQNHDLSSVATDGHILQWIKNLDTEKSCQHFKEYEMIIPARFLKIIGRYVKGPVEVFQSERFLHFKLEHGLEFCVRAINEPYVDFERVIPKDLPHLLTVDKKKLTEQLKAAKPFVAAPNHKIMLKASNGSIRFKAQDMDEETEFSSEMEVQERTGAALDVWLDLDLLEKTVNSMADDVIQWQYGEPDGPNILYGREDENTLHLIMPIRREEG